jgi:hypothetical protein
VKCAAIIGLAGALALAGCAREQQAQPPAGPALGARAAGAVVIRTGAHEMKVAEDANHDGRLDLIKTYRDGRLVKVEQDRNADGRVDLVREYSDNQLSREVRDDNFDGKPETIKTYRKGKLAIVERDPNGSGWAERTDYYDDNGKLLRSETAAPASSAR